MSIAPITNETTLNMFVSFIRNNGLQVVLIDIDVIVCIRYCLPSIHRNITHFLSICNIFIFIHVNKVRLHGIKIYFLHEILAKQRPL